MIDCEEFLYRLVYSMLYTKNDFGADRGGLVGRVYIDSLRDESPTKKVLDVTRICFSSSGNAVLNLWESCFKGGYLPNDVGADMFTIGGFPDALFLDMVPGVRGGHHEILLDINSCMGDMIFFAIGAVGPEEQIAGFGLRAWEVFAFLGVILQVRRGWDIGFLVRCFADGVFSESWNWGIRNWEMVEILDDGHGEIVYLSSQIRHVFFHCSFLLQIHKGR